MTRPDLLSLHDLAQRAGCRIVLVERFFHFGVVEEVEVRDGVPYFTTGAVDRLRRALRLRSDLRIGASSLGLVLDLLDRVERLERALARDAADGAD